MKILLSYVHHCSQMYIFWHLKKKIQIFENMPNLPQNEKFALKCTSLLSNVHHWSQINIFWKQNFKFSKTCQICSQLYIIALKCTFFTIFLILQIFENMPNLPQNEHFALKWTFYSQIRNMKPPLAKPRIVHYQHINQNTLPLVAVTRNNTASFVKTLSNFKHQNLLNVVVLVPTVTMRDGCTCLHYDTFRVIIPCLQLWIVCN